MKQKMALKLLPDQRNTWGIPECTTCPDTSGERKIACDF